MSVIIEDRRHSRELRESALKLGITDQQMDTLYTLERVGWTLRFVRGGRSKEPLAVVFDPDRKSLAVIEPDGRLDENPAIHFRN
jgi:hypothetical protein